jgi:hypothetical protein
MPYCPQKREGNFINAERGNWRRFLGISFVPVSTPQTEPLQRFGLARGYRDLRSVLRSAAVALRKPSRHARRAKREAQLARD